MMYICGLNQSSMPDSGNIIIKGAKVNNLKNLTDRVPRNKFTVVTGISGIWKIHHWHSVHCLLKGDAFG